MALTSDVSRDSNTYFRRVGVVTFVVILGALSLFGWAALAPSTVPFGLLGPLGRFLRYLAVNHRFIFRIGYVVMWLIHLAEASYAVVLCKKKGINHGFTQFRWFVQTLIFGFLSLRYLLAYKPPRRRQ